MVAVAALGLFGVSGSASAQSCTGTADSDFDGDGLPDLAIGAPESTLTGSAQSGSVHLAFGDGATQTITQGAIANNDAGAGDRFGHALASTDWNSDGCSDLFVGVPFENWSNNTVTDAGGVIYIPGSPSGLNTAAAETWSQESFGTAAGTEPGDQFGYSLAAGLMANGTPYLVAGMPGEAVGTTGSAGMVIYATPSNAVLIHQDSTGVSGVAETGDLFGFSMAASESGFVVGGPGEGIEGTSQAGSFIVFEHNNASVVPQELAHMGQNATGVSGTAETGDLMGYALAMVDYLPAGSSTTATLVAVASPGEDLAEYPDAGWVFEFTADGSVAERGTFDQDSSGIAGVRETGDLFGAGLSMVNRTPGAAVAWDDLLIAVGAPGEDAGPHTDRGWVQVFSMIGARGDHELKTFDQLEGAGADWRSEMQLGTSILATADHLYIADPTASEPAVYGIPWGNLIAEGTEPVAVYTPADFGLTASDVGAFGSALA